MPHFEGRNSPPCPSCRASLPPGYKNLAAGRWSDDDDAPAPSPDNPIHDHRYFSLFGWMRFCGLPIDFGTASRLTGMLADLCRQRGLPTGMMRDPRFGNVPLYPESVLRDLFRAVLNGEADL